jgi:Flp pilus assembly protein TadG
MTSISADPGRTGADDRGASGDDTARGEVGVQSVLVLPVILGLLWISVHAAMLFHAGNIAAETAAASARAAARSDTPSSAAVARVAATTVAELGGRLAGDPTVHLGREAVAVSVTVVGPDLVPFLPRTVTRRAVAPVEQFLLEQDR